MIKNQSFNRSRIITGASEQDQRLLNQTIIILCFCCCRCSWYCCSFCCYRCFCCCKCSCCCILFFDRNCCINRRSDFCFQQKKLPTILTAGAPEILLKLLICKTYKPAESPESCFVGTLQNCSQARLTYPD